MLGCCQGLKPFHSTQHLFGTLPRLCMTVDACVHGCCHGDILLALSALPRPSCVEAAALWAAVPPSSHLGCTGAARQTPRGCWQGQRACTAMQQQQQQHAKRITRLQLQTINMSIALNVGNMEVLPHKPNSGTADTSSHCQPTAEEDRALQCTAPHLPAAAFRGLGKARLPGMYSRLTPPTCTQQQTHEPVGISIDRWKCTEQEGPHHPSGPALPVCSSTCVLLQP